jgi:hypothetical protein
LHPDFSETTLIPSLFFPILPRTGGISLTSNI